MSGLITACRIDPFVAERVEVVRGAATLRYGSQAIGGVVNAISQRVPMRLPDDRFAGDVVGGYSTVADSRDLAGQVNARSGAYAPGMPMASRRHAGRLRHAAGRACANSWLRGKGGAWVARGSATTDRVGLGVVRH